MNGCLRTAPLLILTLAALTGSARLVVAQRAPGRGGLVGTWRLAEHWNKDSTGTLTHQFGPQPIGYFVHDVTGHFSVQIMPTPPLPAVSASADTAAIREFVEDYYAAFGTFTVDSTKRESVYHVEGSTVPRIIGTDAHLPYRLSGDSLIIGDSKTWRRGWLRVK